MRRIRSYRVRARIGSFAVALAILPLSANSQETEKNALGFLTGQIETIIDLQLPDGNAASTEQEVDRLLSAVLTPAATSQIALYKNPELRALYEALPAAPPLEGPPGAAVAPQDQHLHSRDLQALLVSTSETAETYESLVAILRVAADAERGFYRAVAASQVVDIVSRMEEAASISAELRRLQDRTGATTKLAIAEAELYEAELSLQTARARADADISRRALIRILGLPAGASLQLPERLPDLPGSLATAPPKRIVDGRPDLLASRWRAIAEQIEAHLAAGEPAREIRLEQAPRALASLEAEIEFQVQQAHANYQLAIEVGTVVTAQIAPMGRVIMDEKLLEYNGMLNDLT
ncbi:MAG: hypothetical protein AB7F74_22645, partial [Parvibaculaceae bacterium]